RTGAYAPGNAHTAPLPEPYWNSVTGRPLTGLLVTGLLVTGLLVTGFPVTGFPVTGLAVGRSVRARPTTDRRSRGRRPDPGAGEPAPGSRTRAGSVSRQGLRPRLEREEAVGAVRAGGDLGGLHGQYAVEAEGPYALPEAAPGHEVPVVAVHQAGHRLHLADRHVAPHVGVVQADDEPGGDGARRGAGP